MLNLKLGYLLLLYYSDALNLLIMVSPNGKSTLISECLNILFVVVRFYNQHKTHIS